MQEIGQRDIEYLWEKGLLLAEILRSRWYSAPLRWLNNLIIT